MTGAVAVIDAGKTHTRVALFSPQGEELAARSTTTPVRRDGPYPAEDVEALEPFVLDALAAFAREHPIRAIVPVAHGSAAALVTRDGLALPVLDYESPLPEAAAGYAALRPDFAESGSPELPAGLNLARQVHWQAQAFPEAFGRAEALLPLPQYWAWRLSGVAASEVTSLGAHSDLWAPAEGRLSSLAARCGWRHLIPPLRRAWDVLGPIRPEIAAATGLDPATAVLAGIHNSNASLLPHLAAGAAPFAMVSTGTWIIVLHVGGALAALDPGADMLANVDALGRPTPSARFMGGREYAAIAGDDAPPDLDAARAVIASGALALPAFSEQGGPWRGRPGRIEGVPPARPGARSALASLYAALVTDDLLLRLGVTGRVIVDGPFAGNPVWRAALAELRPEPGVMVSDAASAAAGAALLAAWPGLPAPRLRPAPPAAPPLGMWALRSDWRAATGGAELL